MFRWYVINTYSGHENKVKHNLEHRVETMSQNRNVRQVVVPTEQVSEIKDGQKIQTEKRTMPGYVLVNMEMTDDAWSLVKNTPGVTGFVGATYRADRPAPLSLDEVLKWLIPAVQVDKKGAKPEIKVLDFEVGDSVTVQFAGKAPAYVVLGVTVTAAPTLTTTTTTPTTPTTPTIRRPPRLPRCLPCSSPRAAATRNT